MSDSHSLSNFANLCNWGHPHQTQRTSCEEGYGIETFFPHFALKFKKLLEKLSNSSQKMSLLHTSSQDDHHTWNLRNAMLSTNPRSKCHFGDQWSTSEQTNTLCEILKFSKYHMSQLHWSKGSAPSVANNVIFGFFKQFRIYDVLRSRGLDTIPLTSGASP